MLHRTGIFIRSIQIDLKCCVIRAASVLRSLNGLSWIEKPEPAKLSDVLRVHDPLYVEHLQTKCHRTSLPQKFDADTILSGKDSFDAALLASGSVITAVDAIANRAAKKVFCAVRPPGHHSDLVVLLLLLRSERNLICVPVDSVS